MVDPMAWPPPSPPNKNSSYLEKVCHSHSQGIPTTGIFKIIVPSDDLSSSYTSPFATRKFDGIETDLFYHHPQLKQNPSMPLKLIHNSHSTFFATIAAASITTNKTKDHCNLVNPFPVMSKQQSKSTQKMPPEQIVRMPAPAPYPPQDAIHQILQPSVTNQN
jgi:hypothetical protein